MPVDCGAVCHQIICDVYYEVVSPVGLSIDVSECSLDVPAAGSLTVMRGPGTVPLNVIQVVG